MNEIMRRDDQSLNDRITYAKALADSGLIPRAFQRQPANVLVATEYGDALGIHPMTALNEINVISGKPALSASLMQSLARAAGHKVRVTGDAERAVCEIVRKDDPEFTHTAEWTRAKAEASGLWGKGHWAKDPALMLKWRAISECVRLACSEVLGGLKYTPEEVVEMTTDYERPDSTPAPSAASPVEHQGHPPAGGGTDSAEDAPVQEPPREDPVEARMRAAWNDADQLRKLYKWMSSAHPDDRRLAMIRQRGIELTQTQQDDDVVDAEVVEEPTQAESLPIETEETAA